MKTYLFSFFIEIVFIPKSSSFSISFFPGWRVFPVGGNSKAPVLPAKAIKSWNDAQIPRAEALQSTAVAPGLRAGVLGPPVGDAVCTGYTCCVTGTGPRSRSWSWEAFLDLTAYTYLGFPNEPKDKYLSETEVYIKYVHYKGPDWFCCQRLSRSYSEL